MKTLSCCRGLERNSMIYRLVDAHTHVHMHSCFCSAVVISNRLALAANLQERDQMKR